MWPVQPREVLTRTSYLRPGKSRSRGQALVELAAILPTFLLLVTVALDAGRMFYSQITITDAAREGALEAASNPKWPVSSASDAGHSSSGAIWETASRLTMAASYRSTIGRPRTS